MRFAEIRHPRFLLAIIFTFTPLLSTWAETQSAAEMDWKAVSGGQCQGRYVAEANGDPSAGGATRAEADDLLHVQDHSTSLSGNVRLEQGTQILHADFATIDAATEVYAAEGKVSLRQPGLLLTGERISGSLFSGTAAIDSASFLIHQNRLHGSAESIEKTTDERLIVRDGQFTTCEPGDNTWAVSGKTIELNPADGYGTAKDVTVRIKDFPVVYFPYLRFPINDTRQSGFLLPSIGHDSDGGTDIAIPYYFNLSENYDATYTLRSIWKRGLMHEGEFRFLSRNTENLIAGTFLPSDDEYDGRTLLTPGTDFEQQDRWLTHIRHRGRYGQWSSAINFTSVSDIDYMDDLGGFTNTDSSFDRSLGSTSTPALVRTGSLKYRWSNWQASLDMRGFQELNQVQPRQYEVIPRLSLTGRENLGPLQTEVTLQATEFDKSSDIDPTGQRLVGDLTLSIPMTASWGYLTPKVRVIHRDYSLDQVSLGGFDDNASVTTTAASLDAGLIFERTTELRGRSVVQTLEPRVQYLFIDDEFQNDIPSFDSTPLTPSYAAMFRDNRFTGYDRIGDADRVALGLTTTYFDEARGTRLLTASIGQIFHFDDRDVNFGAAPGVDPTSDTSPIFLEITSHFGAVRFTAGYEFDSEQGQSNRGHIGVKYRNQSGALFNFTYAMTDESVQRNRQLRNEEETDLAIFWPIADQWRLIGRWNYGWDRGQTIESLVGLEYNDCCWRARLIYRRNLEEPRFLAINNPGVPTQFFLDRRADSGIYFEFQLKGLASLGGRLDSLLRDSLDGYRTE